MTRRKACIASVLALGSLLHTVGCGGGPPTRLRTVRSPTDEGEEVVELTVKNATSVSVNNLFIAETKKVDASDWARMGPRSAEADQLWGTDVLAAAIPPGGEIPLPGASEGTWDIRVLDRDGREQHVHAVKLGAGGKYVLELHDAGWRVRE